jgi:serine/threonine protein kinase
MLDHTLTCKITDFGLSRDLADDYYIVKHGGKIPIRWTAPEAVKNRKYSSSSDVWSYGILVYEIWSLGERPYGSWGNQMVISHLTDGYRLPPPAHCPRPIYALMIDCWHPDHHSRPIFAVILDRLSVEDRSLITNPACEPLLGNLGDDLEVGHAAYRDLQTLYTNCQM